jgi:hypothetical protein
MKLTCVINTHGNPETTYDTVDSVLRYMTNNVLLLVEEAAWDIYASNPQVAMLKAFRHDFYKAPYRNVVLGLLAATQHWSDSDWFCYMEYDCLVGSDAFKMDLSVAERSNVWCIGNDYRTNQKERFPLVERILGEKIDEICYILGACIFFHRRFMQAANERNFFERFLYYTNDFQQDFFPDYDGWDITEHLLPTLVKHWGGEVQQFAKWSKTLGEWTEGDPRKYPIRWRPDLTDDECWEATIMHPIKAFDHPVRIRHRQRRRS